MEMPNEITMWLNEKTQHNWVGIIEPRTVNHEWKKHTGGRIMFAGLTLRVEPKNGFELIISEPEIEGEYVKAVKNGIISVLLSQSWSPILNLKIRVLNLDVHEINSSYAAFYQVSKESIEIALGLKEDEKFNINW